MAKHAVVLVLLAWAWCCLPAFADPIAVTVFQAADGTRYGLSPGVAGGSCAPVSDGMECGGGSGNHSSAHSGTGCGELAGAAFCVVVPVGWNPGVLPLATSTLECAEVNYELSTGNNTGSCSANNGSAMTCTDNGDSTSSATCDSGCGQVTGSGSCKAVAKPAE
ncbi:MAG: hypothetical protein KBD01_07695 [Acidobacteria bacterium]|nr:hypothetical protein [Acidobacteriota bacterium]